MHSDASPSRLLRHWRVRRLSRNQPAFPHTVKHNTPCSHNTQLLSEWVVPWRRICFGHIVLTIKIELRQEKVLISLAQSGQGLTKHYLEAFEGQIRVCDPLLQIVILLKLLPCIQMIADKGSHFNALSRLRRSNTLQTEVLA